MDVVQCLLPEDANKVLEISTRKDVFGHFVELRTSEITTWVTRLLKSLQSPS